MTVQSGDTLISNWRACMNTSIMPEAYKVYDEVVLLYKVAKAGPYVTVLHTGFPYYTVRNLSRNSNNNGRKL